MKILVLLCVLMTITGCSSSNHSSVNVKNQEDSTIRSDKTSTEATFEETSNNLITGSSSSEYPAPNAESNFKKILTRSEALADYEYMWNVLEKNYPSFNVPARKYGISVYDVKEKGAEIIKTQEKWPVVSYYLLLSDTLNNFQNNFHLRMIDPFSYSALLKYTGGIKLYYDSGIIDRDKTRQAYEYLENIYGENDILNYVKEDMKFSKISSEIAMVKINSFFYPTVEDEKQLLNFFQEVAEFDYLIIDISENGGGNDEFWMNYIVSPNIEENVYWENVSLLKGGDINNDYIFKIKDRFGGFLSDDFSYLYKLPNISDDVKDMDYEFIIQHEINPKFSSKVYQGKIFVLIDQLVFSSAESFTAFCKKTGFATIVGRNSGGDGMIYSPVLVSLPESGLVFQYSVLYSLNEDGGSNQEFGTTPDYLCREDETPLETCLRIISEEVNR